MHKGFRLGRPDAARILGTCFALGLLASTLAAQTPLGTSFIYQGRLTQGGAPASGPFDLEFRLFGVDTGGSDVAAPVVIEDVPVTSGLFAVTLDFGAAAFAGQKRWLEIGVRPGASTGAFTPLAGRQELTPTPNAVFSATAGDAATLGGIPSSGYRLTGGVLSVAEGGTGATNAAGARTSLQAAQSGANSDITAISGLTTALSIGQGGTGSTTADGARAAISAQAQLETPAITTLATSSQETSAELGSDGLVLIAYHDLANFDLKVAHCSNAACTSATLSTVDSSGFAGIEPSLAIGADGLGLISYGSSPGSGIALKVAHCSNVACTSATTTTLDSSASQVGQYSSIAIGTDGFGLISYYDSTNGNLKVAHCNNTACTSATITTVEATNQTGQFTSVTIGADGLGLISYYDATLQVLKVAHCSNVACTGAATISTLDDFAGRYSSITTGADGLGLISYQDVNLQALKVAHCSNATCSSATFTVLDDPPTETGWGTSIARGSDGLGVISYWDNWNADLMLARCANAACTSATLSVLDSAGTVGLFPSTTIGADGRVVVSYQDTTNGTLKVFHDGLTLGLNVGGTGATDAASARTNLQAAKTGGNSDITSLSGLTTALSVPQGGTGATSATSARTNLQAAKNGANSDITSLTGLTTPLAVTQGGTGAADIATARANLQAAQRGANGDITSLTGLTTPLGVASGGTGATSTAGALAALGAQPAFGFGTTISTLESSVGNGNSIAIGTDGLGLISHGAPDGLRVVHCSDPFCKTATSLLIGSFSGSAALAIGSDGRGVVAYRGSGLRVARCADTACTSAAITVVTSGNNNMSPGIAIGADGLPLIGYVDADTDDLKVAHCNNLACTASTFTTLDSVGNLSGSTAIVRGADGLGLISYVDSSDGMLKVAHCSNATCSAATLVTLEGADNSGTAIAIGADGLGLISYRSAVGNDLKVAHCSNAACTSATYVTLDTTGDVGGHSSIAIGGDGRAVISYRDETNFDLKVAECTNTTCTSATIRTLDSAGDVGARTSVAIGPDGGFLISYSDYTNSQLKVAHGGVALSVENGGTGATTAAESRASLQAAKSGSNSDITQLTGLTGFRLATGAVAGHVLTSDASGNGTWQSIDFTGSTGTATSSARADHHHDAVYAPAAAPATALSTLDVGAAGAAYTSATTGSDGRGLISYADTTTGHLKVAHCADAACSSATVTTLTTGPVTYNSITIGTDGRGLISFYADDTDDLKVVHCTNAACTTFGAPTTLDSTGDVGWYNSITIGTDGFGLISYDDETAETLKVVHCTNTACSTFNTPATIDATANVGEHISMTIGADGLGLISYFDNSGNDLKVAHCSNTACSSATSTTLDSTGDVGQYTSIAIGLDGLALISYYDVTNDDLKVAHCTNTACTAAGLDVVDSTGLVGKYGSLAIGADGLGLISYHDETNGDLKVAHCTNIACTSTTRSTLASSATNVLGTFTSATIGGDALGLISYVDTTSGDLKVAHCQNLYCSPFAVRRR